MKLDIFNLVQSVMISLLVINYTGILDDYWSVIFEANKAMKSAFYSNGIKVAYFEGFEMGAIGE